MGVFSINPSQCHDRIDEGDVEESKGMKKRRLADEERSHARRIGNRVELGSNVGDR